MRLWRSLRWRLLLSLLGVLAAAAATVGGLTYRAVLADTEALFDYQLQQMALSLRDQGAIAPDQARALADPRLDFVVQIWTEDGRSVYASHRQSHLPGQAVLGLADVEVNGQVWRSFAVAAAGRVIQVAQPERIRRDRAAQAALRSVAPLGWMALPLVLLLGWLVDLLTAPLQRLAADVGRRDAGALAPLPEAEVPDEVRPLVAALNALLGRLDESLATQRAFVADAAHELRSPLTALKLQLRALRDAPSDTDRHAAIQALGEGIDRAARLVEQLLALARNEPGRPPPQPQTLDLAELAGEALADLWPLAQARGQQLALDAEAAVPVRGERAALAALVRNLADNALRYGREGGRVQLQVRTEAGRAWLTVDDDGPGLPAAERERAFDRFWRRDSGRADGSGLGLAIVRAVARRHGGDVGLDDSPLGGLRARAWLPAP